tara:strand:- start:114 stop:794 length:681 start_codon:yes stop_codon:yes gene_type:complete
MFSGLFKAITQLADPLIRKVIIRAVILSAVLFCFLTILISWALGSVTLIGISWLDSIIGLLGGGSTVIFGVLFFPAVAGLLVTFMLEEIARAVERRYYPDLPEPRKETLKEIFGNAARFSLLTLILNFLFLLFVVPIMALTILLIPLIPFVFFTLNGYLLGREYFEFAALRRLNYTSVKKLRAQHKHRIFFCGTIISVMMTIPFINWFMPVVAAAYMVHIFEYIRD